MRTRSIIVGALAAAVARRASVLIDEDPPTSTARELAKKVVLMEPAYEAREMRPARTKDWEQRERPRKRSRRR